MNMKRKYFKRSLMTIAVISVTALVSFSFSLRQPKTKVALDGKTYIVELYIDGKEKKYADDDLKFNTGKFKSVLFMDWGFTGAIYNCTPIDTTSEKKIYTFDCETKPNDKGEIMTWGGTVTGEDIEGTAELQTKKGKTVKSYVFNGSLKPKPGSKPKTTPTK